MLFNFWLNQHLFLALATDSAEPIQRAMNDLPPIPETSQWANFLRNHDEIDLGRLSEEERAAVFAEMGPEPEMQLYGRGIRRRLATMLGGDSRRLELAYSLLFALPGTPVLWYGEEIGMGEDLSLEERNSVRTPMQWSGEENGGFSTVPPDRQIRPIRTEGGYAYEHVNVAAQRRDPGSLLNVIERLIRTRKECPEIGWGTWSLLDTGTPSVLAHFCAWRGRNLLALHNLSREPAIAKLDLTQYQCDHLIDLLDDQDAPPVEEGCFETRLLGYGYQWYRVGSGVSGSPSDSDAISGRTAAKGTRTGGKSPSNGRHASRRQKAGAGR
jgi:maltose alpha-D-glucosyltransferase/alpha-amylase